MSWSNKRFLPKILSWWKGWKKYFLLILLSVKIFCYICVSVFKINNSFAIRMIKYHILKISTTWTTLNRNTFSKKKLNIIHYFLYCIGWIQLLRIRTKKATSIIATRKFPSNLLKEIHEICWTFFNKNSKICQEF